MILFKENQRQCDLSFDYQVTDFLVKQLTALNSTYIYRIVYLGPRFEDTQQMKRHFFSTKDQTQPVVRKRKKGPYVFQKSVVYYRPFNGSNPSLKDQRLQFKADFQSSNLDAAIRVKQNEYDIFLRIDSNTRGHCFWYYFQIQNKTNQQIQSVFNICNLNRNNSLYNRGKRPYAFRNQQWTQQHTRVLNYGQQPLRYNFIYSRLNPTQKFICLTFQVALQPYQNIRIAYNPPYTYTNLIKELNLIQQSHQVKKIQLGHTAGGLVLPGLIIGSGAKIIIVTARVHPGQSNSSYIMQGFIKQILQFKQNKQSNHFLIKCTIIIVPMLNPDGVVLGNFRTGARGRDLNRRFYYNINFQEPKLIINMIQNYVKSKNHELVLYLDFHGHSQKKNAFLYGPQYQLKDQQHLLSRFFAKILCQKRNSLRYHSCSFRIPQHKLGTARAFIQKKQNCPFVFTVQASASSYYDSQILKTVDFTTVQFQSIGKAICQTVIQFITFNISLQTIRKNRRLNYRNKKIGIQKNKQYKICMQKNKIPLDMLNGLQDQTQFDLKYTFKGKDRNDSDAQNQNQDVYIDKFTDRSSTPCGPSNPKRIDKLQRIHLSTQLQQSSYQQDKNIIQKCSFNIQQPKSNFNQIIQQQSKRITQRRIKKQLRRRIQSHTSRYQSSQCKGVVLPSCYYHLVGSSQQTNQPIAMQQKRLSRTLQKRKKYHPSFYSKNKSRKQQKQCQEKSLLSVKVF